MRPEEVADSKLTHPQPCWGIYRLQIGAHQSIASNLLGPLPVFLILKLSCAPVYPWKCHKIRPLSLCPQTRACAWLRFRSSTSSLSNSGSVSHSPDTEETCHAVLFSGHGPVWLQCGTFNWSNEVLSLWHLLVSHLSPISMHFNMEQILIVPYPIVIQQISTYSVLIQSAKIFGNLILSPIGDVSIFWGHWTCISFLHKSEYKLHVIWIMPNDKSNVQEIGTRKKQFAVFTTY